MSFERFRDRGRAPAERAEAIGIEALTFLAAEPERIGRFLAASGIDPSNLRQAAASPGFLAGVLDFMLSDEALLLDFAAAAGIAPETVAATRAATREIFDEGDA